MDPGSLSPGGSECRPALYQAMMEAAVAFSGQSPAAGGRSPLIGQALPAGWQPPWRVPPSDGAPPGPRPFPPRRSISPRPTMSPGGRPHPANLEEAVASAADSVCEMEDTLGLVCNSMERLEEAMDSVVAEVTVIKRSVAYLNGQFGALMFSMQPGTLSSAAAPRAEARSLTPVRRQMGRPPNLRR